MPISGEDYEEKVILFIDILGIKEFSKRNDGKLVELYSKISNLIESDGALTALRKLSPGDNMFFNLAELKDLKYTITSLSDSVIISFNPKHIIFLPALVRTIRILQIYLLTKGLLSRGCIITGKIYHRNDSHVIFGKGLVNAVEEEAKTKDPIVTIHETAICRLNRQISDIKVYRRYAKKGIIGKDAELHMDIIKASIKNIINDAECTPRIDAFNDIEESLNMLKKHPGNDIACLTDLKALIEKNCSYFYKKYKNSCDEKYNSIFMKWDFIKKELANAL